MVGSESDPDVLIATHNKYWGNIERATKFWSELGVNHIMVKDYKDFEFIDSGGKVIEKNFEKLEELQSKHDVSYHFHPYKLQLDEELFSSPLIDRFSDEYSSFLKELDSLIQDCNFYPQITVHPPKFYSSETSVEMSEDNAVKKCREFYEDLDLDSKLALEVMHPYDEGDRENLGTSPSHFREFEDIEGVGMCLDIGHVNMMDHPIESFMEVDLPIYSLHIHANNSLEDQHKIPKPNYLMKSSSLRKLAKDIDGPVVMEVRDNGYTKEDLRECIDFWKDI